MADALISTPRPAGGGIAVDVRGEIDVECTDRLRRLLLDAAAGRPPCLVVDLLHVTFIDSTGMGALAAGHNAAEALGVGFAVSHANGFVAGQLRTTGLYDALTSSG